MKLGYQWCINQLDLLLLMCWENLSMIYLKKYIFWCIGLSKLIQFVIHVQTCLFEPENKAANVTNVCVSSSLNTENLEVNWKKLAVMVLDYCQLLVLEFKPTVGTLLGVWALHLIPCTSVHLTSGNRYWILCEMLAVTYWYLIQCKIYINIWCQKINLSP